MRESARIELRLLCGVSLSHDGKPVPLPASKKTRALLAYLAAAGRPTHRDTLCGLLWDVPDDPRGALRWSLSKLRPLLDTPGRRRLEADRDLIRIDLAGDRVDLFDLRAVTGPALPTTPTEELERQAAQCDIFCEGLDLPRCEGFQAWCIAQREDVRQLRLRLLGELATRLKNEPERALPYARQRVRIDPFNGAARVALIDLLRAAGRRSEAEQQGALAIQALLDAGLDVPAGLRIPAPTSPPAGGSPLGIQHIGFCTTSDGTGIAYSVVGSGPPLVKTANWLNHLDYDWESPIWRHWLRELASHHTLVRYDERGNGLSDWNVADISFAGFLSDLEGVVDAAGLDRFDLLGNSQGCAVSIAYVVKHPHRVRRLILYGGYATGWAKRGTSDEVERRTAMMTLTRRGWGQDNPAFRQMFTTLFFPDATPEQVDWFNELQRMSTSAANAERLQRAFGDIDVRELLPKVNVPTLVLHVQDDAVVPFAAGRNMAMHIPGAQFVALEGRNHLLLEQEPAWPRLVEQLRAFLDG